MIRYIESIGTMQIWDVDGVRVINKIISNITVEQICEEIESFKLFLKEKHYKQGSDTIQRVYSRLGFILLFRLGLEAFRDDFIEMCRWYCGQYFVSWYDDFDAEALAVPSFARVIAVMLDGDTEAYSKCLREKNMRSKGYDDILGELMQDEFELFCKSKILEVLKSGDGLKYMRSKISFARLTRICVSISPDLTENYLSGAAKEITRRREIITKTSLHNEVFGTDYYYNFSEEGCDNQFYNIFCAVVEREEKLQSEKFISENHLEQDVRKDIWKIYFLRGGGLMSRRFDFTQIKSPSLRTEVKYHMAFHLSHRADRGPYLVGYLSHALNILTDKNPNIRFAADITEADVKALLLFMETEYVSPSGIKLDIVTISIVFSCCSRLFGYLMGDMRSSDIRSPRPHQNPFKGVRFANISNYGKKTEVIPESVMESLDVHIDELPEQYALLYKIFSNTGMRAKEALFLEADCIEPSIYDNLFQIKYKPYKVLVARRKAGREDFHRVLIHSALADEIQAWIQKTEDLRRQTGQPYLFLSLNPNSKGRLLGLKTFISAINGLLNRYSIGADGAAPWHFTSRQTRKTTAVTLIENGATAEELAYMLGHLSSTTSMKYYAEVRKMKLAELNTDFFKKQFELRIPAEQLELFNEEERKLLYIDFRLEKRRVEFGFCLRRPEMGGCDRRSNLYGCVNCRHLCTGRQYLSYWQELLCEQERNLTELERSYQNAGVERYNEFREYQQSRLLRDGFKSVVNSILEGGCE